MFERYTESARRVIFFSRYAASQANSREIRPEHMLVACLREGKGLLNSLGCDVTLQMELHREVEPSPDSGPKMPASVDLPLSRAAKRVLAYSTEEAGESENKDIFPGHLLLGILREDARLADILKRYGIEQENVRAALLPRAGVHRAQYLQAVVELQVEFQSITNLLSKDVEPAPVYVLKPPPHGQEQ